MPIGLRVYTAVRRPARELVDGFAGLPPSNIGDCMGRSRCLHPALRYYGVPGGTMLGTAITVRTAPGDNLMVHAALDLAGPGDVLVIDAGGDLSRAIVGELMARRAHLKGLCGMIVDGAMRDVAGIRALGFPVYARGATPAGPYKEGPGEVNVTIACGGTVVRPGDIVVGDEDGVVIVPQGEAETILAATIALAAREEATMAALARGELGADPQRAALLLAKGCEVIDGAEG
jgi:RraA family protein